jgi:hypothetical protein
MGALTTAFPVSVAANACASIHTTEHPADPYHLALSPAAAAVVPLHMLSLPCPFSACPGCRSAGSSRGRASLAAAAGPAAVRRGPGGPDSVPAPGQVEAVVAAAAGPAGQVQECTVGAEEEPEGLCEGAPRLPWRLSLKQLGQLEALQM